jgi:hypothetical protein
MPDLEKTRSPQRGRETAAEYRRHKRALCSEETHFLFKKRLFEGTIKNVSRSGAYIETEGPFVVGQEVTVAGPFEAEGREGKRQAAIVRMDTGGIGVKFK